MAQPMREAQIGAEMTNKSTSRLRTMGAKTAAVAGAIAIGVVITVSSGWIGDSIDRHSQPGAAEPVTDASGWVSCPTGFDIKGNVNAAGERIAHSPAGDYYSKVKPERCFTSIAEASSEGYRASRA